MVYLPPEAQDVPALMAALVAWVEQALRTDIPAPIVAGLAHYQLVTIHPFYDGNGRTACLLATFILHRMGYGLSGFLSIEEFYVRDLAGYYTALAVHPHHNYYMGRADADLSGWFEYFVGSLAEAVVAVGMEARRLADTGIKTEPVFVRALDRRARMVLGLFADREQIGVHEVSAALALSMRMARVLLREWVAAGWLQISNPSRKTRAYVLSAKYRQYLDNLSAKI